MDVLSPVLDADLLVLDDLGVGEDLRWVQETLGLVVNTRYNARRATIFTSNLSDSTDNTDPNTFMFQLGVRTRSRLLEMCEWVEIQGADVREVGPHAPAPTTSRDGRRTRRAPDAERPKNLACCRQDQGHGPRPLKETASSSN